MDRWVRGGGAGGVVRWEANRGGTRDRGDSRDVMLPLRQGENLKMW